MEERLTKKYIDETDIYGENCVDAYFRLKELEDQLYGSREFKRMHDNVLAEREADYEFQYEHADEFGMPNPDDLRVSAADTLRCIIIAAERYRKYLDEVYFTIENSAKHGIDYGVYCKKCTREEFKEIVSTTISALESLAFNIEGYKIEDNPDRFAIEDIKEYLAERENNKQEVANTDRSYI